MKLMNKYFYYILAMTLILSACSKGSDDVVYHPPSLSGIAYVLASNADHIAVVDLQTQELDRLVIAKKGVDLASVNSPTRSGIYILSEDGSLALLPDNQETKLTWQKFLSKGIALTVGENGNLWLLGAKELLLLSPEDKVINRYKLEESFSSIIFDAEHGRIWLLSRERAVAESHDIKTFTMDKSITDLGNSVHQGLAFPGTTELWVAEGNEFRDGKPYGVGFKQDGPAMAGGFNIIASDTGKHSDFVNVGGNVVDMVLGPKSEKVYAVTNRLPYYNEATLAVVGSKSKRTQVLLRLCLACHEIQGVEIPGGQAEVRAIAVLWKEGVFNNRRANN